MTNLGGVNNSQLVPLEAIKPRTSPVSNNNYTSDVGSGLQSFDSVMANRYTDPNNNIPTSDILAPMDALNPEIAGMDKQDTRERGVTGFIGGVFKGFGKAGLDTVKGFATLGKIVVSAVSHPKEAISYVGGGIKYAINNPIKTVKTIAVDLPIGIVKGFVDPYATAIKDGKWGEAVGRGVFDVGMIVLTAGTADKAKNGSQGAGAIEKVSKGSKGTKATKAIESVAENADELASAGTKITNNVNTKLAENALNFKGAKFTNSPVSINIGNVENNVEIAKQLSKLERKVKALEEVSGTIEKVTRTTRKASKLTKAAESTSKISLGLGEFGDTMSRGASSLKKLFKPIGSSIGQSTSSGLTAIFGEKTANIITRGASTVGHGISVGGKFIKDGAMFVKAHPIASSLIAGKTVDIIDKGLKASDNYDPGYIQ